MNMIQTIRAYIYAAALALPLSLTLATNASGAPASQSLPPGEQRMLETETRDTGVRANDRFSRNETLNDIRATPSQPPATNLNPTPAAPAGPAGPQPGLAPLPPLSSGVQTR